MTALQQFDGDVEVLLERQSAPSNMWLLKRFGLPRRDAFRLLDQRDHITIQHLGWQ